MLHLHEPYIVLSTFHVLTRLIFVRTLVYRYYVIALFTDEKIVAQRLLRKPAQKILL